jgi:hypothetical protein
MVMLANQPPIWIASFFQLRVAGCELRAKISAINLNPEPKTAFRIPIPVYPVA